MRQGPINPSDFTECVAHILLGWHFQYTSKNDNININYTYNQDTFLFPGGIWSSVLCYGAGDNSAVWHARLKSCDRDTLSASSRRGWCIALRLTQLLSPYRTRRPIASVRTFPRQKRTKIRPQLSLTLSREVCQSLTEDCSNHRHSLRFV